MKKVLLSFIASAFVMSLATCSFVQKPAEETAPPVETPAAEAPVETPAETPAQ